MSSDADERAPELESRVMDFLTRNFPQIRMHGGSATIEDFDPETDEIFIRLGGACSGCGISPMTIKAIESRLPDAVPEIESVDVETGEADDADDTTPSFPGDSTDGRSESPF